MLAWTVAAFAMGAGGMSVIAPLSMLALSSVWALYYAWRAPLEPRHDSAASRLLIALLALSSPLARAIERYRARARIRMDAQLAASARQRPRIDWLGRSLRLAYWNECHVSRASLLDRILKAASASGLPARIEGGWKDFDVEVHACPWVRLQIKTADEEHEGAKLKNHALARVRLSWTATLGLAAAWSTTVAAGALGLPLAAAAAAAGSVVATAFVLIQALDAGRWAYRAIEQAAADLELVTLGKPVRPPTDAVRAPEARKRAAVLAPQDLVVQRGFESLRRAQS
jgi:hypothetical protein